MISSQPATSSSVRFDTKSVPSGSRLDYWNRVNTRAFSKINVDPHGGNLHGILERREIGPLKLARVYSTPVLLRGGLPTESREHGNGLLLHLQEAGACRNSQLKRSAILRVGDVSFVDASRPYVVECAEPMRRTVIKIPVDLIAQRLDSIDELLAVSLDGTRGVGAILGSVVSSIWRHCDEPRTNDHVAGKAMISAILDLMTLLPDCSLEDRSSSSSMLRLGREMRMFVEDRIADPSLSVSALAQSFGVSPRHVHRVFAEFETTPSGYILDSRLCLAAAQLRDSKCAVSITQIALDSGFSDSTNFSRAFRRKFGASPREFKRERRKN